MSFEVDLRSIIFRSDVSNGLELSCPGSSALCCSSEQL